MGKLTRFGISLDENLLAKFDSLLQEKGYSNRSEGIRDLIRVSLLQNSWTESGVGGGTLTLVYDHHKHDLSRRLMNIQHEENDIIITSVHVHLDHHNCLEVLILKGDCNRIVNLAQKLATCRGVVYGKFIPVPTIGELV